MPAAQSLEERVKLAKERTDKVIKEVLDALLAQEVNAIVVYSQPFADKIPRGAGRAYQQLSRNLQAFEIIRLCVLWDSADDDKESIPTIVRLVEDRDVRACLVQEARERGQTLRPEDDRASGEERAVEDIKRLDEAVAEAKRVQESEELRAVMNVRHKHLAHSLIRTKEERRVERGKAVPIWSWTNGEERELLRQTVDIVAGLQLGILGSSTETWDDVRRKAKRDAHAFWDRVTFRQD